MLKKYLFLGILTGILLFLPSVIFGETDCPTGYVWDTNTIKCIQANCDKIADAHWSYVGDCVCGSSGSIYEDPADPNKECAYGPDHTACPRCIYACVGLDQDCPGTDTGTNTNTNANTNSANTNQDIDQGGFNLNINSSIDLNSNANQNTNTNQNSNSNANTNSNQNVNISQAGTNISLSTSGTIALDCEYKCKKHLWGKKNSELISFSGTYPNCDCQIDVKDDLNRLTSTLSVKGDDETTYIYDKNGNLIKKVKINRKDESEKVRIRLGFKYTQEEIDKILDPKKIEAWFNNQTKDIKTNTSKLSFAFWWQHLVAIFDHGFSGDSADFVDTYQFGRCGDSMLWLERDLLHKLGITGDPDVPGAKHEGILSITGEKYKNLLNHTSIMIRPPGITNQDWNDIVQEMKKLSGGKKTNPGIPPNELKLIDPRLLDAKVLDPYKKEVTTVREFIKGWSYIRIG